MKRIIVIGNQKGGVGKTTTATALTFALQMSGYRVLLIDTDPQCNASDTYAAKIEGESTLYDVLCENAPIEDAIQKTDMGDIVPSDPLLAKAESVLVRTGKEFRLKKAIEPIRDSYDFIIMDTPPALGILSLNALTAADSILIPLTSDRYALQGLAQFRETMQEVREYTNPDLKIEGFVFVKHNHRTLLSKDILQSMPKIAEQMKTKIFDTTIRESIAAREAQAMQKNIFDYSPKSTTALDYLSLKDELLKGV